MKSVAGIGRWLAVAAAIQVGTFAACTNENGLVFEGQVDFGSHGGPGANEDLYLGMWVGSDPAPGVRPVAYAHWSDSNGEVGIELSSNQTTALGKFRWETKTHVAEGAKVRVAGFFEKLVSANGIPDEDAVIYMSDPDPIVITADQLVDVVNGSARYKTELNISISRPTVDVNTAIQATIDKMAEALKQAAQARDATQIEPFLTVFHPWYFDLWQRDYNDVRPYLSGTLGQAVTLKDGPLAGFFTTEQLQHVAVQGVSMQVNDVPPATGIKPDIGRGTADIVFQYQDQDNVRIIRQFWRLYFVMEDGEARVVEWEHTSDGEEDFEIECGTAQVSTAQTIQPKWGTTKDAAESNYEMTIERFYPRNVTWGRERMGVPGPGTITDITTIPRNLTSAETVVSIMAPGGTVVAADSTRVFGFQADRYYRLRVTSVESPVPPVSATCYYPGAEYVQFVRGARSPTTE